ncbi:hypothetical protein ACFSR9_08040 [Deinococcus taklimakanensis]|uniref:Uncharacterized protein n=1 Tax=Deinococcus taklimakanensis TaxID=536443 RepID=A0ABW5P2L7_9DEIO
MSDNATRTLADYLGSGEPMTAKSLAEALGISRQHLNTLIRQVQEISASAIPDRGGRRQYTTALRDLLLEVRQSALPTNEALTAILSTYGAQMPEQPATEDRTAELECRVQGLEATVAEHHGALQEFAAWAHQIGEELDALQTLVNKPPETVRRDYDEKDHVARAPKGPLTSLTLWIRRLQLTRLVLRTTEQD